MAGPAPTWFPLRRQLLDSSVWEENPIVCKLWVTLLLVASEPGRRGTADIHHQTVEPSPAAHDIVGQLSGGIGIGQVQGDAAGRHSQQGYRVIEAVTVAGGDEHG